LYLYQSNRLENLFSLLCNTLATPLSDPLTAEIIVVQNPGMARWLSHRIAEATGIAANLQFPLPATFIWHIFEYTLGKLPDLSAFSREILRWRVLTEIEKLSPEPVTRELRHYLQGDANGLRSFQLADTISDIFDQYLVFRPEMLIDWQKTTTGGDNPPPDDQAETAWQQLLWRRLTEDHPRHRATLLQEFFKQCSQGLLQTENLPERISIFGINTLPPAYLAVIDQLSRYTEIHILHLSPCRQCWDDILPERQLAVKRRKWYQAGIDDVSAYFISGNPLLACMGMLGREFFSIIHQFDPQVTEDYERPGHESLLTSLQTDILDLHDGTRGEKRPLDPNDTSIAFHDCHSPAREVQILHDRLLDLFSADPALKPADILVMAPDITLYAPSIAGVFGAAAGELFIPWSLADRRNRKQELTIDSFLYLLGLANSRCSLGELLTLLENPVIGNTFQIRQQDIPSLRLRVNEAGIRWGLDREQRRAGGLDDSALHTWKFGLERMLLGHVTGPMDGDWQGIIPAATEAGGANEALGGLALFIRRLQRLEKTLRRDHRPEEWRDILLQITHDFFSEELTDYGDAVRLLRETIHDFGEQTTRAACRQPLSCRVIHHYFSGQLAGVPGGQPFLSGKVTFCNMVPMRSVPFKVIWLLGMNDSAYPRCQRPVTFDLMARKPRPGDRNRRDDDRYLFLEALLSARNHLIISWVGRDQRENSELPPSVLVAELRDYIDRSRKVTGNTSASTLLTTCHPLQPFSEKCFDGTATTAGYNSMWLPGCRCRNEKTDLFCSGPLPATGRQEIPLAELVRFWNHPVRFFLEQRLGLRLNIDDEILPDSEPFSLDTLTGYHLTIAMLNTIKKGGDARVICRQAQAAALLPRGEVGTMHCRRLQTTAEYLVAHVEKYAKLPITTREITAAIGGIRLGGLLDGLHAGGRISFRPAKCKAKDILRLWIQHLLLCNMNPPDIKRSSVHIGTDAVITLPPVAEAEAEAELEQLITLFQQGMDEPLHFYPESSYVLASAKNEAAGMKKARKCWYSGYHPGEEEDPAYRLALRGREPLDEQFRTLARLFQPICKIMERADAAA